MLEEMELGINAAREGRKEEALQHFKVVLKLEPNNAVAWLWTAGVLDDPEKKRKCLERVLELEPENPSALRGMAALGAAIRPNYTMANDLAGSHLSPFIDAKTPIKTKPVNQTDFKAGGTLPLRVNENRRNFFGQMSIQRVFITFLLMLIVAIIVGLIIWLLIQIAGTYF